VNALNGAKVLVTGGCGLVGSQIGRVLRAAGATVVALDNLSAYPFDYVRGFGSENHYAEIVQADVADESTVRLLVKRSDFVIHAAALADVAACSRDPSASIRANIVGTQVVLSAVADTKLQRFVYVSSASVYGNQPRATSRCWAEDLNPVLPISVYGNVKTWGEFQVSAILAQAGISYTSLRYFSIYGEPQVPKMGSHSWAVASFAARAYAGKVLPLNNGGHQIRDFVHVKDAAMATVAALTAPLAHNQIVNVGTGIPTSIHDVARMVCEHVPGSSIVTGPTVLEDPTGGYADTRRMHDMLSFAASIPISRGVADYCAWLEQSDLKIDACKAVEDFNI
jgi:UDP-glucose 4-epimerase/dTDP-L-rhamnose 4-epimerase